MTSSINGAQTSPAVDSPPSGMRRIAMLRDGYLIPLGVLFLFAWVLFNGFATVERILHYYTPLPYWDYWRVAQNLSAYEAGDLRVFWQQHNDHRIIFPEIVFALDMLVLHGRLILPLAVSFVCYVATWLLLTATLFADRALSRPVAIAGTLLAGVIALWEGSAAVLAAPFQLQWTLEQLAVACSLVCLWRLKVTSRSLYLCGVVAAALVANYSSGNGLLLWPLLLALSFVVRLKRAHLIAVGIASITSIGIYFIDYRFGSDLQFRTLVTHPLYLTGFIGSYLSMPFGGMKTPEFGECIGWVNLTLTIVLLFAARRLGLLHTSPGIVLFGYYLFTLLTIVLTAAGRMDVTDAAFGAAKASRYITVPLMNWAVFILLSFWICSRARFKIFTPGVLACTISLLLLVYLPKLRDWLSNITEDFSEQQLGALSIENDLTDSNFIGKIFFSTTFIVNYLPELREQHLSIYYKGRQRWLGKPVTQFSQPLDIFMPGRLTRTYPVRGGVEVVGWADGSAMRRPYTWVLLANERDRIIGFGQRFGAGFPYVLRSDDTPPSLAWVGFVNLTTPSRSISAYIIDPHRGGLFRIAGSIEIPAVQPASLEETAGQIAGVTWQKDPSWSENTLPHLVDYGQIPPGVNYGSWSRNDSYTGQALSSTFAAPANRCVILPVLHGPRVAGASVDLLDADTGKAIATAPMQDGETRWEYWRFPVNAEALNLRITARDAGKDWGEWVAIANPLTCR